MSDNQLPLSVSKLTKHNDTTLQDPEPPPNHPEVEVGSTPTMIQPLTEFTIFNTLPTEMRQHIFSLVDNALRLLVLIRSPKTGNVILSTTSPPSILGATRESREIGLKSYETFHIEDGLIMVNWDIDIVLIGNPFMLQEHSEEATAHMIESIVMKCQNLATHEITYRMLQAAPTSRFESLRHVYVCIAVTFWMSNSKDAKHYRFIRPTNDTDPTFVQTLQRCKAYTQNRNGIEHEVDLWRFLYEQEENWRNNDFKKIGEHFYKTDLTFQELREKFPRFFMTSRGSCSHKLLFDRKLSKKFPCADFAILLPPELGWNELLLGRMAGGENWHISEQSVAD